MTGRPGMFAVAYPDPTRNPPVAKAMCRFKECCAALLMWEMADTKIGGQTLGSASNPVAAIAAMFAFLFLLLGFVLWYGLDLKPLGNVAFAVGVVSIFYMIWWFSLGALMFASIAAVWWIACFLTTAVTYGKMPGKYVGGWLLVVAWWTFFIPTLMIVFGIPIP